jgi:hypothetical protein
MRAEVAYTFRLLFWQPGTEVFVEELTKEEGGSSKRSAKTGE